MCTFWDMQHLHALLTKLKYPLAIFKYRVYRDKESKPDQVPAELNRKSPARAESWTAAWEGI